MVQASGEDVRKEISPQQIISQLLQQFSISGIILSSKSLPTAAERLHWLLKVQIVSDSTAGHSAPFYLGVADLQYEYNAWSAKALGAYICYPEAGKMNTVYWK